MSVLLTSSSKASATLSMICKAQRKGPLVVLASVDEFGAEPGHVVRSGLE
jgi:hypothetical protein